MSDTPREVVFIDIGGPASAFPLAVGEAESGTRPRGSVDTDTPRNGGFFSLP